MAIHWRAPLQAKGFLKIIEIVVAILCFSLVAGFSVTATFTCNPTDPIPRENAILMTSYPFRSYRLQFINGTVNNNLPFNVTDQGIAQSAELFVTWGSLSLIYGVVAIIIYMLFTANEQMEKIVDLLVYADLGFHCCWVLCWFVASVDWAVGYNNLNALLSNIGVLNAEVTNCVDGTFSEIRQTQYVQAAIAVVFGFLSLFLWVANIFWVVIDTKFYIQWRANRNGDKPLMS